MNRDWRRYRPYFNRLNAIVYLLERVNVDGWTANMCRQWARRHLPTEGHVARVMLAIFGHQ